MPYIDPRIWDNVMNELRIHKNPLRLFVIWENTIAPILQVPFPINRGSFLPNESRSIALMNDLKDRLEEMRDKHKRIAWFLDYLRLFHQSNLRISLQSVSIIMFEEKIISELD